MAGDRPATRSAACLQKVARAFQHTHRENARSRECVREGKQICHLLRIFLCLFLSVSICLCLSLCLFLSLSLLTHYISHRQGKYEHLPRHGRRLGGCPRHRPRRTLRPAPPAPRQVTVFPSSTSFRRRPIFASPPAAPPSTAPVPPSPRASARKPRAGRAASSPATDWRLQTRERQGRSRFDGCGRWPGMPKARIQAIDVT